MEAAPFGPDDSILFSHVTLFPVYSQHGFDGIAQFSIGDGLVDLTEIIILNEAVKGKPAGTVKRNQFRNKALRHGVALDNTAGLPTQGIRCLKARPYCAEQRLEYLVYASKKPLPRGLRRINHLASAPASLV